MTNNEIVYVQKLLKTMKECKKLIRVINDNSKMSEETHNALLAINEALTTALWSSPKDESQQE